MFVRQIIETKEYFSNDIRPGYFVIYEKLRQNTVTFKSVGIVESRAVIEESIKILKGNAQYSLTNVKCYILGNEYSSVEEVLTAIKKNNSYIFQRELQANH
ncbi:hypothetical protein [Bacillus sp. FJAT-45350]|uniref:hypothetical protein n=1 Tax=Bacillus sp. FJAT-45350 TaxID=2011014 RepID=UPI000BB85531|nr:hypothetical protein [Bacillus sp. FJAT-45350]